jgi:hypothetical protein
MARLTRTERKALEMVMDDTGCELRLCTGTASLKRTWQAALADGRLDASEVAALSAHIGQVDAMAQVSLNNNRAIAGMLDGATREVRG